MMSEALGPSSVPGNEWTKLSPPDLGAWDPSRRVAVILPYYEAQIELSRTLAGLAAQSYPSALFEVVVVDDGSDPPLVLDDPPVGLSISVISQDDRGFGLARARNTGAAAVDAEILIFLDSDMVPERTWLAAHARWHHTVSDALVVGFRRHVEFGSKTAEVIGSAVHDGRMEDVFSGEEVDEPEWINFHMARTKELSAGHHDGFRAITGGNLSVRAEFFSDVGRFDESFTRWGAEDTEFAYRAYVGGAMLIPERTALAWHQGRGATPDANEKSSLEIQREKIASLIADPSFRPESPPRSYLVPRMAVTIDGTGSSVARIVGSVDSLLSSRVVDLAVVVELEGPQTERVRERYRGEPRVAIAAEGAGKSSHSAAWARLDIPAGTVVAEGAIVYLLDALEEVGVVAVELPDGGRAVAMLTRAYRRAQRLVGEEEHEAAAGQLFGARTIAWQDAGLSAGRDWIPAPGLRGRLGDPDSRLGKVARYVAGARSPGDLLRIFRWMARRARRRVGG